MHHPFPDKHCLWPGNSTAIPFIKTRNDSLWQLVLLWQLKAAQVVLLHCFSSKYVSTHSRVENVWVRLHWFCTQSFPQNPFTGILSTAFWDHVQYTQGIPILLDGLKKDLNWRNEILRHWMKFLTNTKTSLRPTWLNMHYVTGVSGITTAC